MHVNDLEKIFLINKKVTLINYAYYALIPVCTLVGWIPTLCSSGHVVLFLNVRLVCVIFFLLPFIRAAWMYQHVLVCQMWQ